MNKPFRFAAQSFNAGSGAEWAEKARKAEALGYSAFHLADHILGPGPALAATNHPVQNLDDGTVLISSQNHGFAVDESKLPANLRITHKSLFDSSLQGIHRTDKAAFSFQGHPEASPGPHDVAYLFDHFFELIDQRQGGAA